MKRQRRLESSDQDAQQGGLRFASVDHSVPVYNASQAQDFGGQNHSQSLPAWQTYGSGSSGELPVISTSTNDAPKSPTFSNHDEPTLNLYNETTIEHVGPSGDTGANYLHSNGLKHVDEESRTTLQRGITQDDGSDPVFFKIVGSPSGHYGAGTANGKTGHEALVDISAVYRTLQRAGPALIDVYLRSAHPTFPIVNRERVVSRLVQMVNSNREPTSAEIPLIILYVSLMLVGHHWHFLLPSTTALPELDINLLRNFRKQALPRQLCMPRLVTIQSILLEHAILVSTHAGDSMIEVWSACGNLVTAAQNLGLHRNPESWNIGKWEIQVRKKLWWAVLMTERWLAYSIGRPSLIQADDWTVLPLLPSDFEPSFDNGAARFIAMANLTSIISDVHSSLFTPRTAARLAADVAATKAIVAPLKNRLAMWYEKERATIESQDLDNSEEVQSPCSLQLAHFAVQVALHRALLRCGAAAGASVRSEAVATMRAIADWAKRISSQDVLSVWWGCAGSQLLAITNFFLSLTISAPTLAEFQNLKKVVSSWRWQLRINLQSFPRLARSALQRLDELFRDGDKLDIIWQTNKYKTPGGGATRAASPATIDTGTDGNAMLDLARLASKLNGHAGDQMSASSIPATTFQQTSNDIEPALFGYDGLPSIDQVFDLQLPDFGASDGLDPNFSLEQFMSWGSPNTGQTYENLRNQNDWVL